MARYLHLSLGVVGVVAHAPIHSMRARGEVEAVPNDVMTLVDDHWHVFPGL
jgi:hypothetical protein